MERNKKNLLRKHYDRMAQESRMKGSGIEDERWPCGGGETKQDNFSDVKTHQQFCPFQTDGMTIKPHPKQGAMFSLVGPLFGPGTHSRVCVWARASVKCKKDLFGCYAVKL